MRKEVRADVKKALAELKKSSSKKYNKLKVEYPLNLSLIKRWNRFDTPEKIIQFYPQLCDIQRVILTSLTLKHTKNSKTPNEELAYLHAIMREMGGWFNKTSKFKYKNELEDSYSYKYIFSSSSFINDPFLWPLTLIVRYTFISSQFQKPLPHGQAKYSYTGYQPTNLIDGFYYTRMFPNGGCPTILSKNLGEK